MLFFWSSFGAKQNWTKKNHTQQMDSAITDTKSLSKLSYLVGYGKVPEPVIILRFDRSVCRFSNVILIKLFV